MTTNRTAKTQEVAAKLTEKQRAVLEAIHNHGANWAVHIQPPANELTPAGQRGLRATLKRLRRAGLTHVIASGWSGWCLSEKGKALASFTTAEEKRPLLSEETKEILGVDVSIQVPDGGEGELGRLANAMRLYYERVAKPAAEAAEKAKARPAPSFEEIAVALREFAKEIDEEVVWLQTIHPNDNERGGGDVAVLNTIKLRASLLADAVVRAGQSLGYLGTDTAGGPCGGRS